jgi:hypothetical protein
MNAQTTRRLAVLGIVAVGLVLATMAVVASTMRTDGPLATVSRAEIRFPLGDGQVATWGMPLSNQTTSDIEVEAVDLVDVTGLEIVGTSTHNPLDGGIGSALGYPPAGIVTSPIAGSIIRGGSALDVLTGLRLAPGASSGGIGGLRVRHNSASNNYETVLPWSLKVYHSLDFAQTTGWDEFEDLLAS